MAKRDAIVIMAVRNREKGLAALDDIKKLLDGREINIVSNAKTIKFIQ